MNKGRQRLTWEETCLRLAYNIAEYRSQDPYVQVGACALKKDNSFILGYNGCLPGKEIDWSDRDLRRNKVLHAESNVLNRILPNEVEFIAITHSPCPECIKIIGQKNIKRVIYGEKRHNLPETEIFANEFEIELIQFSPELKEWLMFQNIRETSQVLRNIWKDVMKDIPKIRIPIKGSPYKV